MLADAIHWLKLSFAKRVPWLGDSPSGVFWQKRYYDRNVRDEREFTKKIALSTPESCEAWAGETAGRLEVEQLPSLSITFDKVLTRA
jgi:hypothetical protein